jgi:hypothetical protein
VERRDPACKYEYEVSSIAVVRTHVWRLEYRSRRLVGDAYAYKHINAERGGDCGANYPLQTHGWGNSASGAAGAFALSASLRTSPPNSLHIDTERLLEGEPRSDPHRCRPAYASLTTPRRRHTSPRQVCVATPDLHQTLLRIHPRHCKDRTHPTHFFAAAAPTPRIGLARRWI